MLSKPFKHAWRDNATEESSELGADKPRLWVSSLYGPFRSWTWWSSWIPFQLRILCDCVNINILFYFMLLKCASSGHLTLQLPEEKLFLGEWKKVLYEKVLRCCWFTHGLIAWFEVTVFYYYRCSEYSNLLSITTNFEAFLLRFLII